MVDAVPIVKGFAPALMVSAKSFSTLLVAESVTRTRKFAVPCVVGVPEITPKLLNPRPEGKAPETKVHT